MCRIIFFAYQCSKSKVLKIFHTCIDTDISQSTYRTNVHGVEDCIADSSLSNIFAIPVVDRSSVAVCVRRVFDQRSQSIFSGIDRRSINTQRFETGTWLPVRIGRTVQRKAGCFFPSATDNGFDFSRILIHQNNRSLRLWRDCNTFVYSIPFLDIKCCLIFSNCLIGFIRGREDKWIFTSPCCLNIISYIVLAVVFNRTVSTCNSQCILQSVFDGRWIVARIGNLFIADLLDRRILCRINRQTAAVQQIMCLCCSVRFTLLQIV